MDANAITGRGSAAARTEATLNAVGGYQCLAPHRLWMDETREAVMAEAARVRLLAGAEPAPGRRSLVEAVRHRVGAALAGVGARLQGAPHVGQAASATGTTGGPSSSRRGR